MAVAIVEGVQDLRGRNYIALCKCVSCGCTERYDPKADDVLSHNLPYFSNSKASYRIPVTV
jgi:hypothetical protein